MKQCDHDQQATRTVDAALDGVAAAMAEQCDYQAGAVVSRTILETPSCCVTLFAFAAGQGLKEHTASFHALVHVIDGTTELTIGGVVHRLNAGDALVMPPDIPHAVRAVTNFKMVLTMAREQSAA